MNNSIPQPLSIKEQQSEINTEKINFSIICNKEYLDFFGEDKEFEQLVKEIAKKQEEKKWIKT
jgi:hypothetical protein